MIVLRSALFNLLFFGFTVVTAMALAAPLPFRRFDARRGAAFWARGVGWLLERVVGIETEVRGAEHIPRGPAIVAAKHQSAWDTIMFHEILPEPAYILKLELRRIPLYGWLTQATGSITVDRAGGARALKKLVSDSRAALEKGRQLVIFPEGRRGAPGTRLPYQPGVAALYAHLDAAVVPVALNSGLFWGRRSFIKRPGRVVVEFLPPIPPGLDRREMLAELERRIETASAALAADAGFG